jgi:hypothetical protein
MNKPNLNNMALGALTEKIVISKFLHNGFDTFEPIITSDIDLVVNKKNKFFRIQIKTSYYVEKTNLFRATILKSNHNKYNLDNIDYFCIYNYEHNCCYNIPKGYLKDISGVTLYPHRTRELNREVIFKSGLSTDYNKFLDNFDLVDN